MYVRYVIYVQNVIYAGTGIFGEVPGDRPGR